MTGNMSMTFPPRSSPCRFLRGGRFVAVISLCIFISTSDQRKNGRQPFRPPRPNSEHSHEVTSSRHTDTDECLMKVCDNVSTICTNSIGGYNCSCKSGFQTHNATACRDTDECHSSWMNDCDRRSTVCSNTVGYYTCSCKNGFETDTFRACKDIDECNVGRPTSTCNTGTENCVNNIGSYRCECKNGFEIKSGNCEDTDECRVYTNVCDPKSSVCANTVGSYTCSCKSGFEVNTNYFRECRDIDECNVGRPTSTCNTGTENCVNNIGSYRCECKNGFEIKSGNCEDTDECRMNVHMCDRVSTTCTNTIGSYTCSCKSGFEVYNYYTRACKDIDECQQNKCDQSTTDCHNTPGSYNCICKTGFLNFNGHNCSDINECQQNICDNSTTDCHNTPGSYNCRCKKGYWILNGRACSDTNECRSSWMNDCDRVSTTCNNTIGSYICYCRSGFHRHNSTACKDSDECLMNEHMCDPESTTCANTIGSYKCVCKIGFHTHNATSCIDIDECEENKCDNSTTYCHNTPGSYKCDCKTGFLDFNDHNCSDVDECSMKVCDNDTTTCINTIGDYNCPCKSGFQAYNATACIGVEANTGTVVGTVVGSLLAVAVGLVVIIAFALLFYYRRRNGTPSGCCKSQAALNPLHENISIDALQQESCFGNSSTVTVKELPKVIQHKLSTQGVLDKEFKLVSMETKDPSTAGKNRDLKKKNRFRNIVPYDKNRVILSQVGGIALSDYINASLIKGYRDRDKLIATQGPVSETINDFWRMICEKDVSVIAMITDLKENNKTKCAKYWPDIGKPLSCNGITISTTSEYLWNGYTSRHFQVTKDSKCWEVTQWHFLSYPDHGVPEDVAKFMTFLKKVCSSKLPGKYTVVHCSAGAGRTGTFIAIDYLVQQGNDSGGVDILGCLQSLRSQRPQMIQNLSQYEFVHTALLFEYTVGATNIYCSRFGKKFAELQKRDLTTGRSKLEAQLQNLEDRKDHKSAEGKIHVLSKSIDKRKLAEMNVTMIQGWKEKDAFITLEFPRSSAIIDVFYSLMKELNCTTVVFLDGEFGTVEPLFPTRGKPVLLRTSNILCTSSSKEAYGTCYKISELKVSNDTYANVAVYANSGEMLAKMEITVLHVTRLVNTEFLEFSVLNSVNDSIKKLNVAGNQRPTVVISRVGDAASAFCVAALNAFEMIRDVKEVDIFQIVQDIQKSRPQFCFSPASYNELYYVVGKYIESNLAAGSIRKGPFHAVTR